MTGVGASLTALFVLMALLFTALVLLLATRPSRRHASGRIATGVTDGSGYAYVDGGSSDCNAADAGCGDGGGGDGGGGGGD
jgi:hypothetical protein